MICIILFMYMTQANYIRFYFNSPLSSFSAMCANIFLWFSQLRFILFKNLHALINSVLLVKLLNLYAVFSFIRILPGTIQKFFSPPLLFLVFKGFENTISLSLGISFFAAFLITFTFQIPIYSVLFHIFYPQCFRYAFLFSPSHRSFHSIKLEASFPLPFGFDHPSTISQSPQIRNLSLCSFICHPLTLLLLGSNIL